MSKMTKEQKEALKARNCAMLERIELLLLAKGISKGEFYAAIPINRSSISAWRTGDSSPSAKKLKKIAEFLEVHPSYLIPIETEKEPASQMESELDSALVKLLVSLTPTELAQVQGFAAALIAARKA